MAGPTAGLQPRPHRLQRGADRLIQRLARIDVNHWAAREIGLAFEVPASAHRVRIGPAPLAPPGIPLEDEIKRRNELQDNRRPRQIAVECRSEEHTSELQSLMRISYAVFCLKKKNSTPDGTPNSI